MRIKLVLFFLLFITLISCSYNYYIDDNKHFLQVNVHNSNNKPGFEYIEKEAVISSCVIYFTDGWCDSLPEKPVYPTLWVLTDKVNTKPPFGEVINMEQRN